MGRSALDCEPTCLDSFAAPRRRQSPRRAEMAAYYLLYFACLPPAQPGSADRWSRSPCHGDSWEFWKIYRQLDPEIQQSQEVRAAIDLFRALDMDIDYVRFAAILAAAKESDMVLLKRIVPRVRDRVFAILSKAYFTLPKMQLQSYLIFTPDDNDELDKYLMGKLGCSSAEELERRIAGGTVSLRVQRSKVGAAAA
ncbi:uncharacterized protein BJ171DRAFT_280275 [Polychytrium aggregatum]|uniref:uncharacterized protein n=1 Tax=Polychytrium aggregatum TaxID=110093 RepID=UPI0022FEFDD2|nr:uncharacterized protein BJ171DRAFT_280275 [Polychytrium aggregatum]KAI9207713.1 hypothetical protein BJ171DRAFT_280275 [Polychytrium aggregatum]